MVIFWNIHQGVCLKAFFPQQDKFGKNPRAGYNLENVQNGSNFGINKAGYTLKNVQNGSKFGQYQQELLHSCKYPEWIIIRSVSTGLATLLQMSRMDPKPLRINRTGYTLANVQNGSEFDHFQQGLVHS